jgi:hypothetical protein
MSDSRMNRSASSLRRLANHRVADAAATVEAQSGWSGVKPRTTKCTPQPHEHMCGQRALAFACGRSLKSVVDSLGHKGPLNVREIRSFFERNTPFRPTELSREALVSRPSETWWAFGGRRLLALLVQFDAGRTDGMGHAFVLDGRMLLDPDCVDGDVMQRVRPEVLARFDYAFILSARDGTRE